MSPGALLWSQGRPWGLSGPFQGRLVRHEGLPVGRLDLPQVGRNPARWGNRRMENCCRTYNCPCNEGCHYCCCLFLIMVRFHFCRHLEPRPAVRRAVAGLPRLEPGWERLQSQDELVEEEDDDEHDDDEEEQEEQEDIYNNERNIIMAVPVQL